MLNEDLIAEMLTVAIRDKNYDLVDLCIAALNDDEYAWQECLTIISDANGE